MMKQKLVVFFVLGFMYQAIYSQSVAPEIVLLAKKQVKLVDNYAELSDDQIQRLEEKATNWLSRLEKLKNKDLEGRLPNNYLDLYTGIVHQTYVTNEVNLVSKLDIAYVPDLDMFYAIYLKYYSYLLRYGQDTPLPEVIFGMLNQETRFLWIKGDYGHSIAPCQLHAATAVWLLTNDKTKTQYSKYIYFDKQRKHHFYSQEAMIEFMFEFLINTKNYAQGSERVGIAAYNGSLPNESYTNAVVRFTIQYLAIHALYENAFSKKPISKNGLMQEIKHIVKQTIPNADWQALDFEGLYKAASTYFEGKFGGYSALGGSSFGEQQGLKVSASRGKVYAPDVYFGRPFIEKKPEIYIFAYFRENLDTTIFYHNKIVEQQLGHAPRYTQSKLDTNFIYLYYETYDENTGTVEKEFIKNASHYRQIADQVTVQCNKVAGKVYTIPGYPVYYDKQKEHKQAPSFFVDERYLKTALRDVPVR